MSTFVSAVRSPTTRPGFELTVVYGLVALRAFDLAQAAIASATGSLASSSAPLLDGTLLLAVLAESILLGRWLVKRRSVIPVRWPVVTDFALSMATIGLSAAYAGPQARLGVWTMWAYPLGLSTAVLLGGSLRSWRWLLAGAGALAAGYAVTVAVPLAGDRSGQATALANAIAFPGFALVTYMFVRFVRRLADTADAATIRVAELERDRSKAVVHNLLPYLKLDRFAEADEQTRLDMVAHAQTTYQQMRSYVDGTQETPDVESCVRSVLGMHWRLTIRTVFNTGRDIMLSDEVLEHVQRAVDTALSNVEQHAPEATVMVSTRATHGRVEIVVHDDGPGFDARSVRHGFGIEEILGRQLAAIGGIGTVLSEPGRGTEVRITVPRELP